MVLFLIIQLYSDRWFGKLGFFRFWRFFLKQQVVANYGSVASGLIGVEAPAFLLPFFNYFSDVSVMINLDTLICFRNTNLNQ